MRLFFLLTLYSFQVLLVGCGSGESSKEEVLEVFLHEYDLNSYEQMIDSDTLRGTWVAIGKGYKEFTTPDGGLQRETFAFKRYFLLYGYASNYRVKNECSASRTVDLTQNGDEVSFGAFKGLVKDNNFINGEFESRIVEEDGLEKSEQFDITMVKISESVNPLGHMASQIPSSISYFASNPTCFQQSNGYISLNGREVSLFNEVNVYPLNIYKASSIGHEYGRLRSSHPNVSFNTEDGDSVSYELIFDSAWDGSLIFNASGNESSITGNFSIQLPSQ